MVTAVLIILIVSYLIGSINSAIIVGKLKSGDDIRHHGSGNAGATNTLRTYGKAAAVFVTLGDCIKSAISCIAAIITAKFLNFTSDQSLILLYTAGFGAVLGHNFPLFFGFKGGKGILVSITALMFADWKIALPIFIICIAVMAITKYVSLGSVLGAVLFVIFGLIFRWDTPPYIVYTIIMASLAIFKHRTNIKRLLNGTESKLGQKSKK